MPHPARLGRARVSPGSKKRVRKFSKLSDGRERVLTLVRSLRKKHVRGGIAEERGHPRRRAPFGMSYRHPELIPPLKFWPHPQSCAVSTHRPMKARELASSGERLSSRATPTNTTCHAAELHVRPRSCRAFARRSRESSLPTETFYPKRVLYPPFPPSPFAPLFSSSLILVYIYIKTIYTYIYRYIYWIVSSRMPKRKIVRARNQRKRYFLAWKRSTD